MRPFIHDITGLEVKSLIAPTRLGRSAFVPVRVSGALVATLAIV
jgi:hypothetical protein